MTESKVDLKVKHIVYVDDDEEDRAFFTDAAREIKRNIQFRVFENGYDLIGFLRNIQNQQQLPLTIVCDMKMPLLDGIELLKLLKKEPAWRDIPVVIFTTSSSTKDISDSLDAGAIAFFSKPSSLVELRTTIEKILDLSGELIS